METAFLDQHSAKIQLLQIIFLFFKLDILF